MTRNQHEQLIWELALQKMRAEVREAEAKADRAEAELETALLQQRHLRVHFSKRDPDDDVQ